MKTCEQCGSSPSYGTFPNVVFCDPCRAAFFGRPVLSFAQTAEITKRPVVPFAEQMARIDSERPDWHRSRGGKK